MKTEPSAASRALRAVALCITLVAILTVSTVAYSAYQEYGVIKAGRVGLSLTSTQSGPGTTLRLNGTVPNKGLYPVEVDIAYDARGPGGLLASTSFPPISLPPGTNQTVDESAALDLFGSPQAEGLAGLLVNGSELVVQYNVTARLEPFASISVVTNTSQRFAPLMGNLSVGSGVQGSQGGQSTATFRVSFQDSNSFSVPLTVYLTLFSGTQPIANSTSTSVQANPGVVTSFGLTTRTSSPLPAGAYRGLLTVVVAGSEVQIPVEVQVA